MKSIGTAFKIAALAAVTVLGTGATSSTLNYRIHYLSEAGAEEPGFPYPYVGYSEYYCDGNVVTYGLVTYRQEYEFVADC